MSHDGWTVRYLVLLEERDFLLFTNGLSRLDSDHGECWMGGRSLAGLEEVKLSARESRLGWGDCSGVSCRVCGATGGDMKEPSTKD